MQAPDFRALFVAPLEALGLEYMVTGSVAASIYGQPRFTNDLDLVLHLRQESIVALCSAFPGEEYYCPPPEVIRVETSRRSRAHFNLIHHATGLKADCYLFVGDDLQAWALQRRVRLELEPGAGMWVAPIEYVLLRKLEFHREGGSEKHLRDIEGMIAVGAEPIDWEFVNAQAIRRGLSDLVARVHPPKR